MVIAECRNRVGEVNGDAALTGERTNEVPQVVGGHPPTSQVDQQHVVAMQAMDNGVTPGMAWGARDPPWVGSTTSGARTRTADLRRARLHGRSAREPVETDSGDRGGLLHAEVVATAWDLHEVTVR